MTCELENVLTKAIVVHPSVGTGLDTDVRVGDPFMQRSANCDEIEGDAAAFMMRVRLLPARASSSFDGEEDGRVIGSSLALVTFSELTTDPGVQHV
jgi:hypothetical protein